MIVDTLLPFLTSCLICHKIILSLQSYPMSNRQVTLANWHALRFQSKSHQIINFLTVRNSNLFLILLSEANFKPQTRILCIVWEVCPYTINKSQVLKQLHGTNFWNTEAITNLKNLLSFFFHYYIIELYS